MWVIVSSSRSDESYPILGDKKYVVGRIGCDITLNDPSVSRRQSVLMMAHYEANVVKSFITPSLSLEDTSKFGTFVNGESVKKKPCNMVTLKDGDKIQFGGSPSSVFIAKYEPFIATTSCLEKVPKKNLQRVMCLLGGHVVRDWRSSCHILIMAKINVTIKVICAINNQKPIVTPNYLDHFYQFLMGERDSKPEPMDYLPEVVDKEVPAGVSFHPDIRRSTLLKDLKFYFLSAHQFNKTNLAVSTAGGLPILLEDGTEEDAEVMTQDGTIVVAVSKDVLTSLSPTCQKFVRTVCLVLKKKDLRMITDPEIGWAILTCNTDDFCNPKSGITPSMYSSMASQSMSQMTDMDDMQQHVTNTLLSTQQGQEHTNNTQQQQVNTTQQQPRAEKRPAIAMEKEDDLSRHQATMKDAMSLQSPLSKRTKPESHASQLQQSLFGTETETSSRRESHMYSASLFKIPQTPVVAGVDRSEMKSIDDEKCTENDDDNYVESQLNTKKRDKIKNVNDDSTLSLKGNGSYSARMFATKVVVEDICRSSNASDSGDNNVNDEGESGINKTNGSDLKRCGNLPSEANDDDKLSPSHNSKHMNSLFDELNEKNNTSPPACGFLNRNGNKKNISTSLDEGDSKNGENSSSSSPSSQSALSKGKRKKRALFNDCSEKEDESSHLSVGRKQMKFDKCDRDRNVNSVKDKTNDVPSPSVICNGDINVKQENVTWPASSKSNSGLNHQPDTNHALWTTVKKEEGDEERLSDEQKVNMDLVLDSQGQPLRHVCKVKVVDLIARVSTSHTGGRTAANKTAQHQQQLGVKNFKRFKKTNHCGSERLPTIIGGRDLEPHKGSKLSHIEGLLKDATAGGTQNGVEQNNRDTVFRW